MVAVGLELALSGWDASQLLSAMLLCTLSLLLGLLVSDRERSAAGRGRLALSAQRLPPPTEHEECKAICSVKIRPPGFFLISL